MATLAVLKPKGSVTHFSGVDAPGTFGWFTGKLGNTNGAGELYAVQKPRSLRGKALYIYHLWINVTTAPTGGVLTVGVGTAADATTFDNSIAGGVNYGSVITREHAQVPELWAAAEDWITVSRQAGDATGMEGNIFIAYRDIIDGQEEPSL